MKKVFFIALAFGMFFTSCSEATEETNTEENTEAQPAEEETVEVEEEVVIVDGYAYYGIEEMNAEGAISIEEMNAIVDSTGAFEGKVVAQLAGVCQKAGCWVTLENPGKDPVRVFFGDHDFFVPINTQIGKDVILQGKTDIDTFTVAFQKHLLDDEVAAGNEVPQEAYDAITEDKIETSFIATGILIQP
jgi:hypothetical protein